MSAPAPLAYRPLTALRLDQHGNTLAEGVTAGHVISHYPQLGLMFDVRAPKSVRSLKAAKAHAAKVDLLGRTGEWTVPDVRELRHITDYGRQSPAVDPLLFPNMPSGGWVYSESPVAWSSDRVWFVCLSSGVVLWGLDGLDGLVVPVLRVPASQ